VSPFDFLHFGLKDFVETLIIAFALFTVYKWIRGSFAVPAVIGLIIIFVVNILVNALGFTTIHFILRNLVDVGVLAVFILFQPEIRKLLYKLGQNTSIDRFFKANHDGVATEEILESVRHLSRHKTGALIVLANHASLTDIIESGEHIDARVNSRLIQSIFDKDSPLHDGAIIIQHNRIVSASCYLPISQNPSLTSGLGTRHRAAIGVTENTNVFVIVVSEESGRISTAYQGNIHIGLSMQQVRDEINLIVREQTQQKLEPVFADE